jgi:AcrR family transcriptional regulator
MTQEKRRYDSTRRSRQATQTRRDVLDAAIELFGESGWSGTTLAAIAERAGVAVETIYSGFGSKKGLLRSAMDVAIVGDTAEVPLADRSESRTLSTGSRDQRLRTAASFLADIHERSVGVWLAIVEAARGDPEVARWHRELEDGRRIEVASTLERMLGHPVVGRHLEVLWAIFGPDFYAKLVREAGMSRADYEASIVDAGEAFAGEPRAS